MLKKLFCIFLIFILCFCFMSCGENNNNKTVVNSPLEIISIVYDSHGSVIQQITYNENTSEYLMTEFYYKSVDGVWTCVEQKVTIINSNYPIANN